MRLTNPTSAPLRVHVDEHGALRHLFEVARESCASQRHGKGESCGAAESRCEGRGENPQDTRQGTGAAHDGQRGGTQILANPPARRSCSR